MSALVLDSMRQALHENAASAPSAISAPCCSAQDRRRRPVRLAVPGVRAQTIAAMVRIQRVPLRGWADPHPQSQSVIRSRIRASLRTTPYHREIGMTRIPTCTTANHGRKVRAVPASGPTRHDPLRIAEAALLREAALRRSRRLSGWSARRRRAGVSDAQRRPLQARQVTPVVVTRAACGAGRALEESGDDALRLHPVGREHVARRFDRASSPSAPGRKRPGGTEPLGVARRRSASSATRRAVRVGVVRSSGIACACCS